MADPVVVRAGDGQRPPEAPGGVFDGLSRSAASEHTAS
jgi:hypothetical protein